MIHDSLEQFLAALRAGRRTLGRRGPGAGQGAACGPMALIMIEDAAEIETTLRHHLALGFARVAAFAPPDLPQPALTDPRLDWVRADTRSPSAGTDIVNAVTPAIPAGQWLYYCYNAEYLYFPFSEDRGIAELCAFLAEERRDAAACVTVDLYASDLTAHPDGLSREQAHFDRLGYFAHGRRDAQNRPLDRQVDIFGGLRWRFEEHVPPERRQIVRVALFRADRGLKLGEDHRFDRAAYNELQCPWHRSPTAAICSFRAAKALRRNPASRDVIASFDWAGATPFEWRARQLLDLGLMEPGQWF
ncbi:glycosyltransferase family 2 protein [Limimaricola cinnabarinus]|uniref:glycosyltransferase family 2 protein n=1 Tax=Limimaricola cinnabarinus TaxID=1125964 RepID=UPI0024913BD8|nr:hypothetical protein [Limimaricola cinnabarinus]